jgi:glutamine amidotransferase
VTTPAVPADLHRAHAIVIPGVGHFDRTASLDDGWRDAIARRVAAGMPLFGICLGLQWLFDGSCEAPDVKGFGAFSGMCERLSSSLKVPHVGWNSLTLAGSTRLLQGIPDAAQVYFTHSYAAPVVDATAAVTEYGTTFSAAVERDNICAVQFHPEKSGDVGLQILRNWLGTVGALSGPRSLSPDLGA